MWGGVRKSSRSKGPGGGGFSSREEGREPALCGSTFHPFFLLILKQDVNLSKTQRHEMIAQDWSSQDVCLVLKVFSHFIQLA